MMRTRVLVLQGHEEILPEKYVVNLDKDGIEYGVLDGPVTLESFKDYSCCISINPKDPFSEEEKQALIKCKEEENLGLMMVFAPSHQADSDRLTQNADFIKSILGSKLVTKNTQPKFHIGKYNLEYAYTDTHGFSPKSYEKTSKVEVEIDGENLRRRIQFKPQPFFKSRTKTLRIDEGDVYFSSFSGCEKSRVLLERKMLVRTEEDGKFQEFDDDFNLNSLYDLTDSFYQGKYINGADFRLSFDSKDFLKKLIEDLSNVCVVSDFSRPGRAIFLSSLEPFNEIESNGKFAKQCQDFLGDCAFWLSQTSKYTDKPVKETNVTRSPEAKPLILIQQPEPRAFQQTSRPSVQLPDDMVEAERVSKEVLILSGSMFDPYTDAKKERETLLDLWHGLELHKEEFYKQLESTRVRVDKAGAVLDDVPLGKDGLGPFRFLYQSPVRDFLKYVEDRRRKLREIEERLKE
jgi:hypothetical protein